MSASNRVFTLFNNVNDNNDNIDETINIYIDLYIKHNIKRLLNAVDGSVIKTILFANELNDRIFKELLNRLFSGEENEAIRDVFTMFRRLIRGALTKSDLLMDSLLKINPRISEKDYNQKISDMVTSYLQYTINNLKYLPESQISENDSFRNYCKVSY